MSFLCLARQYGMPRFLTHEAIAVGLLSDKHCTATGPLGNWKQELTNNEALIMTVIHRMEKDWLATPPKQRRPWHVKDLETLFQLIAGIIVWGIASKDHQSYPARVIAVHPRKSQTKLWWRFTNRSLFWNIVHSHRTEYSLSSHQLLCPPRFELRHGDADISSMLEHCVPPPDINKISIFSHHLVRYNQEANIVFQLC